MLKTLRDFKIGRPQVFAGLLLVLFFVQSIWVANGRRLSDLEYDYIAAGFRKPAGDQLGAISPLTGLLAVSSLRLLSNLRPVMPFSLRTWLATPHPWIIRLPFVLLGVWLGSALWWVARRLFGDLGGYVALALYCFSPAMVKISSNIGPEIILAWGTFGLVYTAIGVAHTVYAPPRKWIPRIMVLGVAIGACLATALWSFTVVLLAFAFMLYLSPARRKAALLIFLGASAIGLVLLGIVWAITGNFGAISGAPLTPRATMELVRNVGFAFADSDAYLGFDYILPVLLAAALVIYGVWRRAQYFGNTAPLITSFTTVLLFAMVPEMHMWEATLGLSFAFLFIGGVAADLFEAPLGQVLSSVLFAILAAKGVLSVSLLRGWIHQNPI